MLSTTVRIRIQEILHRISMGDGVSLQERIYVNKYASRNQNVSSWLRKASHIQRNKGKCEPVDELLNGLDLCSSDPLSTYNPDQDDLGEWFTGAPAWVRKS